MHFQGKQFNPCESRMARTRMIHKLLYVGVVVLCIISFWNARLLYKSKDDLSPKHADFMRQVMSQRDTLFDTINILKAKCEGENHGGDQKPLASRNSSCSKPHLWKKPEEVDLEEALVLGYRRKQQVFLTVGIPTVQRETQSYLGKTLDSLLDSATPEEQLNTIFLIFLADQEEEKRYAIKNMLMDSYMTYLENGQIQVIQAPSSFYPPLKNLKKNFGDKEDRVRWRSKQVVDFAFMFLYAQPLSQYYMQIEDDVITTGGWISAIAEYIEEREMDNWVTLEFSVLGFIGKLFHAADLDRLAQFLMFFYEDQPVDFLYKYFNVLNGQMETFIRAPTLFQHMGKQSSLKDKKMDAQDQFFEPDEKQFRDSDNPPGRVFSNMEPFSSYVSRLAYGSGSGFFWTKNPRENDYIVLVFKEPTLIMRIAITTGSNKHPSDTIVEGSVGVSPLLLSNGNDGTLPQCSDFVEVGKFVSGQFDVGNIAALFPQKVSCLRILVEKSQDKWLVVREIAVWIPH